MSQRLPPHAEAVVVGTGARAAGGLTALQVTMSVRAQKLAPRESHMIDKAGQRIATARLRSIGDDVQGFDRFVALGAPALTQAAFPWLAARRAAGDPAPRLPLVVALPSPRRPGFDPRLERDFLAALAARTQVPLDPGRSELVFRCRGGGAVAFERALALLRRGDAAAVAVGGVDTFFDPDALEHLDRELRLHGQDTENGFVPGEGAGFVVLSSRAHARGPRGSARVLSVAVEAEPRPYGSSEPCLALGISRAVERAVEAASLAGARSIPWALTDVANERHRVDEWTYAFVRAHGAFTPDAVHDQPLLHTGDLGAASAAVLLVTAATRWETGCGLGARALIAVHSDGPERGAMVVAEEAA
ncbi:beta-ketoacyl synthase N-terminal-like domain-containing protein [Sorangium sp. So ce134]